MILSQTKMAFYELLYAEIKEGTLENCQSMYAITKSVNRIKSGRVAAEHKTLLYAAVESKSIEKVKFVAEVIYSRDLNDVMNFSPAREYQSLMSMAIHSGVDEIIDYFLDSKYMKLNKSKNDLLQAAYRAKNMRVFALLLNRHYQWAPESLNEICAGYDVKYLEIFIKYLSVRELNRTESGIEPPIISAARTATDTGYLECFQLLLNHKDVDVNIYSSDHESLINVLTIANIYPEAYRIFARCKRVTYYHEESGRYSISMIYSLNSNQIFAEILMEERPELFTENHSTGSACLFYHARENPKNLALLLTSPPIKRHNKECCEGLLSRLSKYFPSHTIMLLTDYPEFRMDLSEGHPFKHAVGAQKVEVVDKLIRKGVYDVKDINLDAYINNMNNWKGEINSRFVACMNPTCNVGIFKPQSISIVEFNEDPLKVILECRKRHGYDTVFGKHLYCLVLMYKKGYIIPKEGSLMCQRFFDFILKLPEELQIILCFRVHFSTEDFVSNKEATELISSFFVSFHAKKIK